MMDNRRLIRGVLFDLGGTLMYAKQPWPPILAQANQALADELCAQGLTLDCDQLRDAFRQRLDLYYEQRDEDLYETTYMSVLNGLLTEQGYPDVTEAVIRRALDAMYTITQSNWALEEDTIYLLKTLFSQGYHLGIVSNAGDNKDVFQLIERFGIEHYFDFILTSAACSYRKPHRRIFEVALAHWKFQPIETAMVGDTLEADILGANQLGIYSILVTRRVDGPAAHQTHIQPDSAVKTLAEIPALLDSLHEH